MSIWKRLYNYLFPSKETQICKVVSTINYINTVGKEDGFISGHQYKKLLSAYNKYKKLTGHFYYGK